MTPNPGHLPPDAIGKRVRVRLANGKTGADWQAATTRWTRTGHPFDVDAYEVIG